MLQPTTTTYSAYSSIVYYSFHDKILVQNDV